MKTEFMGFELVKVYESPLVMGLPRVKAWKATLIAPGRPDIKIFVGQKLTVKNKIKHFWEQKLCAS